MASLHPVPFSLSAVFLLLGSAGGLFSPVAFKELERWVEELSELVSKFS